MSDMAGERVKTIEPTVFQEELLNLKQNLEYAKKVLSKREWTSLMDIVARYAAKELGFEVYVGDAPAGEDE
jgi:hypothetical protein